MIISTSSQPTMRYKGFLTDSFLTADGSFLFITFIKHASLLIEFSGKKIYVDPVLAYGDFSKLPKADLLLITHEHHDHLDPLAIKLLQKPETIIVANKNSCKILGEGHILMNGERFEFNSEVDILAIPAYNVTEGHLMYHPKGRDNGYVLMMGGSKVYLSGDTEDIAEMKLLKDVDIAFISINQPYTMTIEEACHATSMILPHILYPYHFTDTDVHQLEVALDKIKNIEVRMRPMA